MHQDQHPRAAALSRFLRWGWCAGQRGQIAILVAFAAIGMFTIVGLAIDAGRLYATRAELSRAVDAAALAGVVELPNVEQAKTRAEQFLAENEPHAAAAIQSDTANNAVSVDATKTVQLYFLPIVGIDTADVSAHAKAGFGVAFLDAALLLDATGSMAGDPIDNAKDAAATFKDTMLGSAPNGRTTIGVASFRGCYRSQDQSEYAPKPLYYDHCVNDDAQTTFLTSDLSGLEDGIAAIDAEGGSGTNVCAGLLKGLEILDGPGNHLDDVDEDETLRRYVILLSDGDSTYNDYSFQWSPASPHPDCRPDSSPWNSDGYLGTSCRGAYTREREIDAKAWELAQSMQSAGIEIYVVGFGVCDHDSGPEYSDTQCDTQIGNGDHDNTADERLLKCIASSSSSSNDHYFWASDADELPTVFSQIASQIAHRLIE